MIASRFKNHFRVYIKLYQLISQKIRRGIQDWIFETKKKLEHQMSPYDVTKFTSGGFSN